MLETRVLPGQIQALCLHQRKCVCGRCLFTCLLTDRQEGETDGESADCSNTSVKLTAVKALCANCLWLCYKRTEGPGREIGGRGGGSCCLLVA